MNILMWVHIAGGSLALLSGTAAIVARKGGRLHARAGTWFFVSMLVLGITAAILEPYRSPPASPIGGLLTCYFVATSWVTARRRDGTTGWFEIAACMFALVAGAITVWAGATGGSTTPAGTGPVIVFGAVALLAGLLDINAIVRSRLSPVQRLSRHLWRMCVGFFIATGAFFLGQQDVMPQAVRGSLILFVLAFAPFGVMLFWLVRLRFAKAIARSKQSGLIFIGRQPQSRA